MSKLHAEICTIDNIQKAENSDFLFSIAVKGFFVVTSISTYKVGDLVVYLPPDSLLDSKLIAHAFAGSKLIPDSPDSHRLRTVKIRKNISEGMILDISDELILLYPEIAKTKLWDDVGDILNVKKYEPPIRSLPKGMQVKSSTKNPYFVEYTDIDNLKHYPTIFQEGEEVYLTTKRHGTSSRYSWLPTTYDKWWKKILKFFGLMPKFEFCIGSRRCQIHLKGYKNGFYAEDVYTKIANQYDLKNKLKPNEQLFGEIIGDKIQGHYTYSCKPGEQKFEAYDIQIDGKYLDAEDFLKFCKERDIPTVPLEYIGPYSTDMVHKLKKGDDPDQKIKEGIVIKPVIDRHHPLIGRMVMKLINDDYLTQKQEVTDFH